MTKEIKKYAPVFIPTLNRYEHFKRCIESLSRCSLAGETEVYIGLDYPPSEKYWDGYEKIKEYLSNCGDLEFKKIHVIVRETNYGAIENWTDLQNRLLADNSIIIATEDDNEFSKNFLEYMNKAFIKFWNVAEITAISGYNYPISMTGYEKNIYSSHLFSAWGVGLWKHKSFNIDKSFVNYLHSTHAFCRLLRKDLFIATSILLMIANNQEWEDTIRTSFNIINSKLTLFPKKSLVRNWGHDGTGVNCGKSMDTDPYTKQSIDNSSSINLDEIVITDLYLRSHKKHFYVSFIQLLYILKIYSKYLIHKRFPNLRL